MGWVMSELAIEDALSLEERERICGRAFADNPHLRGAAVADLLSLYDDADVCLARSEPFWEERGRELMPEVRLVGEVDDRYASALLRQSVIAAELLGETDDWAVGLAMQAATASRGHLTR